MDGRWWKEFLYVRNFEDYLKNWILNQRIIFENVFILHTMKKTAKNSINAKKVDIPYACMPSRSVISGSLWAHVCSPPGFLVHGIFPARILKWVPFPFPDILYAAVKSLQSCPTLCDPIDGSPPGSPVPGILQARTLEWVYYIRNDKSALTLKHN